MIFTIRYHETYEEDFDVEAETAEEAERKFSEELAEDDYMLDHIEMSDSGFRALEPNESPAESNEKPAPVFSQKELNLLSDALLQASQNAREAARLIYDAEINTQIKAHLEALAALNSKICDAMTE